jgi:uncharacterized metal-binding protein
VLGRSNQFEGDAWNMDMYGRDKNAQNVCFPQHKTVVHSENDIDLNIMIILKINLIFLDPCIVE